MQTKLLNIPPAYLTTAAANILNCNTTSTSGPVGYTPTQDYLILKHIRLMNNDAAPHTVTLYKGATAGSAGGTEFAFDHIPVPANSFLDWYSTGARFDAADFLTGICDSATKVTINIEAEIGVAG